MCLELFPTDVLSNEPTFYSMKRPHRFVFDIVIIVGLAILFILHAALTFLPPFLSSVFQMICAVAYSDSTAVRGSSFFAAVAVWFATNSTNPLSRLFLQLSSLLVLLV